MIRSAFLILALVPAGLAAQSIGYAEDLFRHGLHDDATSAFLTILYDDGRDPADRSEALYFLGNIAFDQNRLSVALADWLRLVEEYPGSERTMEIAGRLDQLTELVGDFLDETAASVVARSYLRNGGFYSSAGVVP